MYWLFNNRIFNVRGSEVFISLRQKRNFTGEVGDEVIFFEFNNQRHLFTQLFKITRISKRGFENNQVNKVIDITLQLVRGFGEGKEIEDYVFSFPRIKYFKESLYRHFNKKYYRLTEQEFTAVVDDQIFLSRTILGTILNSMHVDHRKAFSQVLTERYPGILQNIYVNSDVLDLLREYFEYAIIVPARQLSEAYETMRQIIDNDIPLGEVSFSDNTNSRNSDNNVRNQVSVIREYLEQIDISITDNERRDVNESKFESIFKNKPLPIDLND